LQHYKHTLIILLALGSSTTFAFTGPETPNIHNFRVVNDHLYSGAQPTPQDLKDLAKLGIKTVIDLRMGDEHAGEEKKLVEALGMRYVNVPMKGLARPKDEQISQVLSILESSSEWPIFVHCRRGKDRTGTVIACYRISHDHWQNQKALSEARSNGLSRLEIGMQHYILGFVEPRDHAVSQTNTRTAGAQP
jgi:tyrosine-protein phosphatase SIW14